MTSQYASPAQWLDNAQRIRDSDNDNLIFFTGPTGGGKSTLAYQVLKTLDPDNFGVERIAFTITRFLELSRKTPRGHSILNDEASVGARLAMHGPNRQLMRRLQVCRERNHHMGLCFPFVNQIDTAIFNDRVRFWAHVPQRGVFTLREADRKLTFNNHGEPIMYVRWIDRGTFTFPRLEGREWQTYLDAKAAHNASNEDEYAKPSAQHQAEAELSGDWDGLTDYLRTAKRDFDAKRSTL